MTSITEILKEREEDFTRQAWKDDLYDHSYFIRRLHQTQSLEGHRGCVNAIAWDHTGRWMVSGSDDCRLNIWRPLEPFRTDPNRYLLCSLPTSHPNNIFACKFMNSSSNADLPPSDIISCSADGLVQWTHVSASIYAESSQLALHRTLPSMTTPQHYAPPNSGFQCHVDMAFDVEPDPLGFGSCFFSCSQDGTVNLYDLRIRSSCACEGCNQHTYIDVNAIPKQDQSHTQLPKGLSRDSITPTQLQELRMNQAERSYLRSLVGCKSDLGVLNRTNRARSQRFGRIGLFSSIYEQPHGAIGITAMSIRQDHPVQMALACTDDFVRIYDRRYLTSPVYTVPNEDADHFACPSMESYRGLVYMFSPSHSRQGLDGYRRLYERRVIGKAKQRNELKEFMPEPTLVEWRENGPENKAMEESYGRAFSSAHLSWMSYCRKITSLCYDPAGTGDLLVSYSGCNLYWIRPTNLRPFLGTSNSGHGSSFRSSSSESEMERESPSRGKRQRIPSFVLHCDEVMEQFKRDVCSVYWPIYCPEQKEDYDKDIMCAYAGHRNQDTMIKEARFFHYPGLRYLYDETKDERIVCPTYGHSAYVLSGSDEGNVYIWRKQPISEKEEQSLSDQSDHSSTSEQSYPVVRRPDFILKGDRRIVNCLQPHPHLPLLACSGIDSDIKIFMPTGGYGYEMDLIQDLERIRKEAIDIHVRRNRRARIQHYPGVSSEEESESEVDLQNEGPNIGRVVIPPGVLLTMLALGNQVIDSVALETESEEDH